MCLGIFFLLLLCFCGISFLLKAFTLQPEEPFVVGGLHIFPALGGSSLSLEELAYLVTRLYLCFYSVFQFISGLQGLLSTHRVKNGILGIFLFLSYLIGSK